MRLRTRVTLVSAVLMAVVLSATGVFVYLRLQTELRRTLDETLRSRADAELLVVEELGIAPARPARRCVRAADRPDGSVVESSSSIAGAPAFASGGVRAPTFSERERRDDRGRGRAGEDARRPGRRRGVLVVGASLDDQRTTLGRLATALAIGGPLALILAVGVTWLLVGWTLRPVESMRAEAAAISAGDPGAGCRSRAPATSSRSGRDAERDAGPARGGDRTRAAVRRRREPRAPDAAVEPEGRARPRPAPFAHGRRSWSARSVAPRRRRIGSRGSPTTCSCSRARTAGVCRSGASRSTSRRWWADTVDSFAARASERGVGIDVHVPGELRADVDELRMRQALGNLLDNGLRYVPAGGRLSVAAERDDGSLRLEVRDDGPGFPAEFLPVAFEAVRAPGRVEVPTGGRDRSRPARSWPPSRRRTAGPPRPRTPPAAAPS